MKLNLLSFLLSNYQLIIIGKFIIFIKYGMINCEKNNNL